MLAQIDASLRPRLIFRGEALVIGRDATCDRVIDSPVVSGRHARITRSGDRLMIEDMGSANGTFVNDRPVTAPELVKPGDILGLGSYSLVLADDPSREARSAVPLPQPNAADTPASAWAALAAWVARNSGRLAGLILASVLAAVAIVALLRVSPAGADEQARDLASVATWLGLVAIGIGQLSDAAMFGEHARLLANRGGQRSRGRHTRFPVVSASWRPSASRNP